LKRALFGYRRADVERVLAEAELAAGRAAELARTYELRSGQLEAALEQTRVGCAERDRRIAWLEAELDLSRSYAASELRGLAALGAELEDLRLGARGQATRIRLQALREAAEVSGRVRTIVGAPEGAAESLLRALERSIDRLGSVWEGAEAEDGVDSPQPAAGPVVPPDPELAELEAALERHGGSAVVEPPEDERILVDIGPFSDFSQLVSFEDAANAIDATSEISIRRFSGGRASIDVSLREPIDLLGELKSRCELDFEVRSSGAGELILDLAA